MRLCVFSIFFGVLLAGCNSDPSCRRETALMRAEIMDLEDKYFLMKSQRDDALNELYSQGKSDQANRIKRRSPADRLPAISTPGVMTEGIEYYPHETRPSDPSILNVPEGSDWDRPANSSPASEESSEEIPSLGGGLGAQSSFPNRPSATAASRANSGGINPKINPNRQLNTPSKNVHDMVIDLMHTGPQRDPIQGTPILQVLLRPLTVDNEVVFDSGRLSIQLQDPTDKSPAGNLGQWEFMPDELYLFYRRTTPMGILLELPLDKVPANGAELEVVCEYQTADDRSLQSRAIVPLDRTLKKSSPIEIQHGDDDLLAQFEVENGLQVSQRQKQPSRVSTSPIRKTERPQWQPNR